MSTTVKGFPFPEPTDPITDYPALAEDLADLLELHVPLRLHRVEFSAVVAAGNDVVTLGAQTFEAVAYDFEFFAPAATGPSSGAAEIIASLYDGAAKVAELCRTGMPTWGSGNLSTSSPMFGRFRLTPSAGPHTYKIRAEGTGSIRAGNGAAGALVPGYLGVERV